MFATGRDKTLISTAWFWSILGLQELSKLNEVRLCLPITETEKFVTSTSPQSI